MAEQQQSYYRILHLLDNTPAAAKASELTALFNRLGIVDPYNIRNSSPNADRVGSLQAAENPDDKPGQGFTSGNKINTGGSDGQVWDGSSMNEDQIGAPLKKVISGTLGATLLTHLANLRATLTRLNAAYENRITTDEKRDDVVEQHYQRLKAIEKALAEKESTLQADIAAIEQQEQQSAQQQQAPKPQLSYRKLISDLMVTDALLRDEWMPQIKQDVKNVTQFLKAPTQTLDQEAHNITHAAEDTIQQSPFATPNPLKMNLRPY